MQDLGIGLVPFAPLGRGFLSGKIKSYEDIPEGDFRRNDPRYQPDNLQKEFANCRSGKKIAAKYKATPAQIAIAWTLHQGEDIVPIPGTKHLKYPRRKPWRGTRLNSEKMTLRPLMSLSGKRAGERYEPRQMAWVDR